MQPTNETWLAEHTRDPCVRLLLRLYQHHSGRFGWTFFIDSQQKDLLASVFGGYPAHPVVFQPESLSKSVTTILTIISFFYVGITWNWIWWQRNILASLWVWGPQESRLSAWSCRLWQSHPWSQTGFFGRPMPTFLWAHRLAFDLSRSPVGALLCRIWQLICTALVPRRRQRPLGGRSRRQTCPSIWCKWLGPLWVNPKESENASGHFSVAPSKKLLLVL